MSVAPLLERPAWKLLQRHYATLRTRHLRDLFAADSQRGEPPVPPYAVNPFFSEKGAQSPSRVPRPRLCVGVRIRLTFTV
jgi:hypothetical protein